MCHPHAIVVLQILDVDFRYVQLGADTLKFKFSGISHFAFAVEQQFIAFLFSRRPAHYRTDKHHNQDGYDDVSHHAAPRRLMTISATTAM